VRIGGLGTDSPVAEGMVRNEPSLSAMPHNNSG
jgi:hypothetical protein